MSKKQPLKAGEKILFIIFGAFIIMAIISYFILEYIRLTKDTPIFENLTTYNFSVDGHKGAMLFRVKGRCTACHRALQNGTNMGLSLDGIGSKRSPEWIYSFLTEPGKTQAESYKSGVFDHGPGKEAGYVALMSDDERRYIAAFLSELRAERGSSSSPMPPEGRSPFIDSMIGTWAPEEWKHKYKDVREGDEPELMTQQRAERKKQREERERAANNE